MKKKGEVWKRLGIGLSVILTVFWLFPYLYVVCCSFKPGDVYKRQFYHRGNNEISHFFGKPLGCAFSLECSCFYL